MDHPEDGYPIQLVKIRPSGKIEIEEKALQIISECDLPVGFVAVVGKYRTGKSFLLNKLLYLEGKGVNYMLFSSKLIHRPLLALREFGCGQNPYTTSV